MDANDFTFNARAFIAFQYQVPEEASVCMCVPVKCVQCILCGILYGGGVFREC